VCRSDAPVKKAATLRQASISRRQGRRRHFGALASGVRSARTGPSAAAARSGTQGEIPGAPNDARATAVTIRDAARGVGRRGARARCLTPRDPLIDSPRGKRCGIPRGCESLSVPLRWADAAVCGAAFGHHGCQQDVSSWTQPASERPSYVKKRHDLRPGRGPLAPAAHGLRPCCLPTLRTAVATPIGCLTGWKLPPSPLRRTAACRLQSSGTVKRSTRRWGR
jgi:hypothetical protein